MAQQYEQTQYNSDEYREQISSLTQRGIQRQTDATVQDDRDFAAKQEELDASAKTKMEMAREFEAERKKLVMEQEDFYESKGKTIAKNVRKDIVSGKIKNYSDKKLVATISRLSTVEGTEVDTYMDALTSELESRKKPLSGYSDSDGDGKDDDGKVTVNGKEVKIKRGTTSESGKKWIKAGGKWHDVTNKGKPKKTSTINTKKAAQYFAASKFRRGIDATQASSLVQGAREQRMAQDQAASEVMEDGVSDEDMSVGSQGAFETRIFRPEKPVYKYSFNQSHVPPNKLLFEAKLFSSRRSNLQSPYTEEPMVGTPNFTTMMGPRYKNTPRKMPLTNPMIKETRRIPVSEPKVGSFSNPMLSLMQRPNVRFRTKDGKFPRL